MIDGVMAMHIMNIFPISPLACSYMCPIMALVMNIVHSFCFLSSMALVMFHEWNPHNFKNVMASLHTIKLFKIGNSTCHSTPGLIAKVNTGK